MPGTSKRQAGQRDRRDREAKLPPTPAPEAVAVSTARFWAERQERADQDYRVRQLLKRREPDLDASQRVRRSCLIVTLPSDMVTVARSARSTKTAARAASTRTLSALLCVPSQVRRRHPSAAHARRSRARLTRARRARRRAHSRSSSCTAGLARLAARASRSPQVRVRPCMLGTTCEAEHERTACLQRDSVRAYQDRPCHDRYDCVRAHQIGHTMSTRAFRCAASLASHSAHCTHRTPHHVRQRGLTDLRFQPPRSTCDKRRDAARATQPPRARALCARRTPRRQPRDRWQARPPAQLVVHSRGAATEARRSRAEGTRCRGGQSPSGARTPSSAACTACAACAACATRPNLATIALGYRGPCI